MNGDRLKTNPAVGRAGRPYLSIAAGIVFQTFCGVSLPAAAVAGDDVGAQLAIIARVGPQAAGSVEARAACNSLSEQSAAILPQLLIAMDTDNPISANWYRAAYEAIVARERAAGIGRFPLPDLKAFAADPKHRGQVRRLSLALCDSLETGYAAKLIRTALTDPEFRGDAVEAALTTAQQALTGGDSESARADFQQAFEHSRDSQQTLRAAAGLQGLGEQVDVLSHLGLVVDWWLIGPFDAPAFTGFARVFPPEEKVDLDAEYIGQDARPIRWSRHHAADPLGLVNLVQAVAPAREAVGYAYAEIESPREQVGQVRCGADDNCTVWLNGQKVFGRAQWLNGVRFDRFTAAVTLRAGRNQLLVKVCQGPPNKDPQVPNNWSLQLRLCDAEGRGLPFRVSTAAETSNK